MDGPYLYALSGGKRMERGRNIARALCIRRLRRHQGRPAVHRRLRQGRAPERRLPAESREGNCHHASFPFPPHLPGIYGGCRPGRESLSYRRVRTPRRAGLHQPGLHAGHTPDGTGMAGTGPAAGPRPLPAGGTAAGGWRCTPAAPTAPRAP